MLDVVLRHQHGTFSLDVAFTAPAPGVTVLFGPSGAGKSTVLHAVAGLLRPDAGRVALGGAVLLDTAQHVDLDARHRGCGLVFQDARLFPHLSVRGNLMYGARRAPRNAPGPGLDDVVALLGIGPLLGRRPRTLSGGERQRVALGRALLRRPRLLLMDEPLASLDAPRRAEVLPFIERLRDAGALPMLYVTHDRDEAERLADLLVLMDGGRVVASGTPQALSVRTDLPLLSARDDAGAMLSCTVEAHDAARHVTRLSFPGGTLDGPLRREPEGAVVQVRVRARDVVLLRQHPGPCSGAVVPVVVAALRDAGPQHVWVTVQAGPTALLARVTRHAAARMGLEPGLALHAVLPASGA